MFEGGAARAKSEGRMNYHMSENEKRLTPEEPETREVVSKNFIEQKVFTIPCIPGFRRSQTVICTLVMPKVFC